MSFKRKLVAYFVVLTLLPLAAVFATFGPTVERSETEIVDARLRAGLRAAASAYREEANRAAAVADRLAREQPFQRALERRDRHALARFVRGARGVHVAAGAMRLGPSAGAIVRRISVMAPGGVRSLGTVVAIVPFDGRLATHLTERSGLEAGEQIVVVDQGRVVAGVGALRGVALPVAPGPTATVAGPTGRYRVAAAEAAPGGGPVLAAIAPQSKVEAGIWEGKRRLLLAFAACLVLVALVAYLEGRAIVRTVHELVDAVGAIAGGRLDRRVAVRGRDELARLGTAFNEMAGELEERLAELETERLRVRQATLRFGQALSATHDVDQLRRTVVETAVDATSASGGALRSAGAELVRCGVLDGDDRLELPLRSGAESFGTLVLTGPRFTREDVEAASVLAGHAAVALDNARLHRIVERQALVDAVTGLANRRRAEEALVAELARAERFETPVALLLADLDDFKAVNDLHGHQAGDAVLRAFAETLAANVRDVDLAARWGGEEFLVVLPGTDAAGAVGAAERVREEVAARRIPLPDGSVVRITASFGVASHPPAISLNELIARADEALYRAKRAGKNRVEGCPMGNAVSACD